MDLRAATLLVATNFMVGRCTASAIASASRKSFFCQGAYKDYEFGRVTMNNRWQQGLSDARTTLQAAPWLAPTPQDVGVRVFDVMHDILVGKSKAAPQATSPMEEISAPGPQGKNESVPEGGQFGTG